jgi:lipoprotein-anchoring transpeptidase ErfK/SrfK
MISWKRTLRRISAVVVGAAGLAVLAPSAVTPATQDTVVSWASPTPGDGVVLGVAAKTQLSFRLAASSAAPVVNVRIRGTSGSPTGAVLKHVDGNPGKATFSWTPRVSQIGRYRVTFTAGTDVPGVGANRTIVIRVGRANNPPPVAASLPGVYPKRFNLSDKATETYRWAFVRHRTVARSGPSRRARALERIYYRTPELYRNAVQVLDAIKYKKGTSWVRIRLAVLPNGSTGWVPRGSLTGFSKTHKRLVISHSRLRATLYNRGRPIFSTIVGVGQSHYPTPRGDFYVREKLSGYYAPAYGPRAFGLNARSATLTDWPGGGFIGIHGTNAPGILPGRVSHGCVRMRNDAILRLYRLMPIGTPVQIR